MFCNGWGTGNKNNRRKGHTKVGKGDWARIHDSIYPKRFIGSFMTRTKSSKRGEPCIVFHNTTKSNKVSFIPQQFHTTRWDGRGYKTGKGEGKGETGPNGILYLKVRRSSEDEQRRWYASVNTMEVVGVDEGAKHHQRSRSKPPAPLQQAEPAASNEHASSDPTTAISKPCATSKFLGNYFEKKLSFPRRKPETQTGRTQ